MNSGAEILAGGRQAIAAAADALREFHAVLSHLPNGELGLLAGELAELRAWCAAQLVAVVAEAESRGVIEQSQCGSTRAWVAEYASHSRREACIIGKAAAVLRRPDLAAVVESVLQVDVDPGTAVVVAAEYDKLAPDLADGAGPVVLDQLLAVGAQWGPGGVRHLKQELLARYGQQGEFEKHQDRCRRQIELSPGTETAPGVWDYTLTADNEGRAVLEAAIGPLSAPHPDPVTGTPDSTPTGRRRGQALIEVLRRGAAATEHGPSSPKAVLSVVVDFATLAQQVGAAAAAGTIAGTVAAGVLIAPDTIRKIACDAGIVPFVCNSHSEILDQGRQVRLFTPGQIRALWLRDQHCTFPGCDTPAAWCDAHHLRHWVDGGATTLSNAGLLCPRHHTVVHRDRLAATITHTHTDTATGSATDTDTGHRVVWDLRPGSYQSPPRATDQPAPPPPDRSGPRHPAGRADPTRPERSRTPYPATGSAPTTATRVRRT